MQTSLRSKLFRSCFIVSIVASFLLTGCLGPTTMRSSFIGFSHAYADASNHQMLLNLARRANGHPAYFLQLGAINSTFTFTTSAGASGGNAPMPTLPLAAQGFLNLGRTEQPTVSITPLAGKSFASAVFDPINPRIFFNLLQQGEAADKLLRTLVSSIRFTAPKTGETIDVINVPDFEDPERYIDFLRVAGILRELQRKNLLQIAESGNAFSLTDEAYHEIFRLRDENPDLKFRTVWKPGPAVSSPDTNTTQRLILSLRLRTFEGVMDALASEQGMFAQAEKATFQGTPILNLIPVSQRRPIIRIDWSKIKIPVTEPVAKANYHGKTYEVRDELPIFGKKTTREDQTWNRDIFVLLNHLYTQISLDPSSLPVQQLIQVR